jgi:hypothetical protein
VSTGVALPGYAGFLAWPSRLFVNPEEKGVTQLADSTLVALLDAVPHTMPAIDDFRPGGTAGAAYAWSSIAMTDPDD